MTQNNDICVLIRKKEFINLHPVHSSSSNWSQLNWKISKLLKRKCSSSNGFTIELEIDSVKTKNLILKSSQILHLFSLNLTHSCNSIKEAKIAIQTAQKAGDTHVPIHITNYSFETAHDDSLEQKWTGKIAREELERVKKFTLLVECSETENLFATSIHKSP